VPIAAFRCDSPARCGAFADERRVVGGDEGRRVWTRSARPVPSAPLCGHSVLLPSVTWPQRVKVAAVRCGLRGLCSNGLRLVTTVALIATFRCDAPARCNAFADARRVLASDGGGRVRTRKLIQAPRAVRRHGRHRAGARRIAPSRTSRSSPPALLRPRVAARSPTSGVSLPGR
jgi:hypothetical protein